MSYILDALKKSEQERKQGEIPTLQTIQNMGEGQPPRKKLWPYLVIAALLLNAAVLTYWLLPSFTNDQAADTGMIAKLSAAPETVEKAPEETDHSMATAESQDTAKTEPSPEIKTVAAQPAFLPSTDHEPLITSDEQAPIETEPVVVESEEPWPSYPVAEETEPVAQTAPPIMPDVTFEQETPKSTTAKKIPKFNDLPPTIRRELPDLNISAHFYSNNPASRMASINGRVLRQGQFVNEGLQIEEITTSGIIFNFRDTRFILKVF